jgi:hypothetical protein
MRVGRWRGRCEAVAVDLGNGLADGGLPGSWLSGGQMTWTEAVSGPFAGCTCLWQDLDGLHVEVPPLDAPPTSIIWGWRGSSFLVRGRLDRDTAYVAVADDVTALDPDIGPVLTAHTVPWALDDGRMAAAVGAADAGRGPGRERWGVGARYEQIIVGGIETGPITFVRPAADAPAADV